MMDRPKRDEKAPAAEDGSAVNPFVPGICKKRVRAAGEDFGTVITDECRFKRLI